jgi:hypothetical protein
LTYSDINAVVGKDKRRVGTGELGVRHGDDFVLRSGTVVEVLCRLKSGAQIPES